MTIDHFEQLGLPDVPGVYRFLNDAGEIVYIGKATSLRDRVRSYFNDDVIATRGRRIVDMVAQAETVTYDVTPSVLEALILEANQIKAYAPKYNVQQKDNKSYNFVVITEEDFPKLITIRGRTLELNFPKDQARHVFGPFPSGSSLREALKIIRKIFPYRDAKCVPAKDQKTTYKKPCFARQIGLCPGVCTGEISKKEYASIIRHLVLFFGGKKKQLIESLEKEMKAYAKDAQFEHAQRVKQQIFALDHINDIALIRDDRIDVQPLRHVVDASEEIDTDPYASDGGIGSRVGIYRIEAYDIAHTGGKEQVGVMVVVENGVVEKSWYRKFKIRSQKGSNDIGALSEIVKRRLRHSEWPLPQLIVMDGAEPQRKAGENALHEAGMVEVGIKVVSVVKDRAHKPKGIVTDGTVEADEIVAREKQAILAANAEAHRFAIAYHRSWRNKLFK